MKYNHRQTEENGRNTGMKTKPSRQGTMFQSQSFTDWWNFPILPGMACTWASGGYTAIDIISRKKRMQGYNVLFPRAGTHSDCPPKTMRLLIKFILRLLEKMYKTLKTA